MELSFHTVASVRRPFVAIALVVAASASLGCAGPMARGPAKSDTNKRLGSAMSDDSIPSAAAVGLADAAKTAKATKPEDDPLPEDDTMPADDTAPAADEP
jgi:hypothetical protein